MKVIDIVKLSNKYLAGEQLTLSRLLPFLDAVIDDINSELNATFPTFSELNFVELSDDVVYDCFPDKYIRSVVCLGAACKFYATDEEGEAVAQDYQMRYNQNLFYMLRDYVDRVPLVYQSDDTGGVHIHEDYTQYRTPFRFDIWRW